MRRSIASVLADSSDISFITSAVRPAISNFLRAWLLCAEISCLISLLFLIAACAELQRLLAGSG
jgi:hypothetical protein